VIKVDPAIQCHVARFSSIAVIVAYITFGNNERLPEPDVNNILISIVRNGGSQRKISSLLAQLETVLLLHRPRLHAENCLRISIQDVIFLHQPLYLLVLPHGRVECVPVVLHAVRRGEISVRGSLRSGAVAGLRYPSRIMDVYDAGNLVNFVQGTDDGVPSLQLLHGISLLRVEPEIIALEVDGVVAHHLFVLLCNVRAVDGGVPPGQPLVQRRHVRAILKVLVRLGAMEELRQDMCPGPSDDSIRNRGRLYLAISSY